MIQIWVQPCGVNPSLNLVSSRKRSAIKDQSHLLISLESETKSLVITQGFAWEKSGEKSPVQRNGTNTSVAFLRALQNH